MFRGDHLDLHRTVNRAVASARELGHVRVGSEHLLLALTALGSGVAGSGAGLAGGSVGAARADGGLGETVSAVLARHGVTAVAVLEAVRQAAPRGAGACADRDLLAPLGIDVDGVLAGMGPSVLDRVTGGEPMLPLGAARVRRRCARLVPPLGLDAQAAYEASLRLALARRDREHRPEHLALCLVALDPGVAWVLRAVHVENRAPRPPASSPRPGPAVPTHDRPHGHGRGGGHGTHHRLTGRWPVAYTLK